MKPLVQTPSITLHDLNRVQDHDKFAEVVGGEIHWSLPHMSPSILHFFIIGNVYNILHPFVRQHKLGIFASDGLTFVLHTDANGIKTTRVPDGAFIRRGRITKATNLDVAFVGAPDLAIEVVSPTETTKQTDEKISDYRQYGTEQVWVLFPHSRTLHQHIFNEKIIRVYRENDTMRCDTFFPNLEIRIADFFVIDLNEDDE
jgi:Uma2 family endonuclease